MHRPPQCSPLFFFNDTATTEIYTLSLHDALPIYRISLGMKQLQADPWQGIEAKFPVAVRLTGRVTNITDYGAFVELEPGIEDRKSTRLNSSHQIISYAVFCLKKKKTCTHIGMMSY